MPATVFPLVAVDRGVVYHIDPSGAPNAVLQWDDVGSVTDGEILVRWRLEGASWTSSTRVRFWIRQSGGGGSENGYYADVRSTTNRLYRVTSGTFTQLDSFATSLKATGEWYLTRFRFVGTSLQAKTWLESSAEPGSWDVSATDSDHSSGAVALSGRGDTDRHRVFSLVTIDEAGGTADFDTSGAGITHETWADYDGEIPDGWVESVDTATWISAADSFPGSSGATLAPSSGVALHYAGTEPDRGSIEWSSPGDFADGEILVRVLAPAWYSDATRVRVCLRMQGASSNNGYVFQLRELGYQLGRWSSGSFNTLSSTLTGGIASGSWYWMRLQAIGADIKAKFWLDGVTEPAGWDIEVTDGSPILTAGKAALQAPILPNLEDEISPAIVYDVVGVHNNAGTAPSDGDSLGANEFFTDFGDTPFSGIPADWAEGWEHDATQWSETLWGSSTVVSNPWTEPDGWTRIFEDDFDAGVWTWDDAFSDSIYMFAGVTPSEINTLEWTDQGDDGDTEVVGRLLQLGYDNFSDIGPLVACRLSGAKGSEEGYFAGLRRTSVGGILNVALFRCSGGTFTQVATYELPWVRGVYTWVRLRAVDSEGEIRVRAWEDGDPEPAGWDIQWTEATPLADGGVGIAYRDVRGPGGCDFFGYEFGGGTAPTDPPGPAQPEILSADVGPLQANFIGSTYFHTAPVSAHQDTEIEVDVAAGDYSAPVSTYSGAPTEGGLVEGLSGATDYKARMRYQAASGAWSDWSDDFTFTTEAAVPPDTPSLSIVSVEDIEATLGITPFSHSDSEKEHGTTEWEIDLFVEDFSTPLFEVTTVAAEHPPWERLFTGLTAETSYKARARHVTAEGVPSAWSGALSFTTDAEPGAERPTKPTIVAVTNIEARNACFEASAYSSPVSSPHATTEWAVTTDPAFPDAILWRYTQATSPLTEICTTAIPVYQLQPFYEHGVKVRYRDAEGRWSSWSDVFGFTTLSDVRGPPFTSHKNGSPVSCGTNVDIEWDESRFEIGTTWDVELSTDFGETWTRLSTAQALASYTWSVPSDATRFGYIFRVRANTPSDGTGAWGYLSLLVDCGNAIVKEPPFDLSEWTQIWDVHRAVWGPPGSGPSPWLECTYPPDILTFPGGNSGTGPFPTRYHDWSLLYHPDFGQVLDCDMEINIWESVRSFYSHFGWKTLSEREHPMGLGIMGTGERVPYEDVPPGDPLDPANSFFDQLTGLTGIFVFFQIVAPWPLGELPPAFYFAGVPIGDWQNNNLGCGTPSLGKRLGFGRPHLRLRIYDGTPNGFYAKSYYWPEGVEAPVQDFVLDPAWYPCNYFPEYGIRLSIRTLNIRENGNRDLRIRAALTGPLDEPYGNGQWVINEVVEDVPITCGWPGAVTHMRTTKGFGTSAHAFDSLSVVPIDYAGCVEGVEEPAELVIPTEGLCPDPEPVTNPALYFGRYFDEDSAGFTTPADIVLYSKSALDVDVPIPCTVTTREVAPRTTVGDNLFRNVWLVIGGQSSGVVIVTPIVDGELKTECARTFIVDWDPENPTPPFLRRYEIALYESIEGESYLGKRGLRGTHFKLKVEVQRTWDCGQLFLHGFDLGWLPATERHNDVVEVEEPWIKTEPYDTGHLFFGSYFEEDSAGFTEEARLLEYGGNPEQESEFFQDDDGVAIPRRIKSREIAPYGVSGEAIFRNVYLAILRYNTAALTINVIPVVNDVEHDPIAVVLPGVSKPMLDVREVSLAQDVLVDNVVVGRRALRGTWFRLELDIDELPAGLVYVESRGVQHSPATESEVNVP